MSLRPIIHNGEVVSIDHLAPFIFECPCTEIDRALRVEAAFSSHCYTCKFDSERHDKTEIVVYDGGSRPRVFDIIRHQLSYGLPTIIGDLPGKRINQTPEQRNYVYAVPMEVAGHMYEVFFMVQRAAKGSGADLRLTVESAYPVKVPHQLPKRPSSIRFNVLAYKVFKGERVRFSPR